MVILMLSDELWSKVKEIRLQHQIYNKPNLRMMIEAMLYRMRVGCPWRDLPVEFGFWHSIYQQFNRWSSKDKLMKIFKDLVQDPDLEGEFIEGSGVRAHQHSSGAAREQNQAIGKSVGGNTTKIHIADYTIADKGYDNEAIRALIRDTGSTPLIPRKRTQRQEIMTSGHNGTL